jgi:hypothetical protein
LARLKENPPALLLVLLDAFGGAASSGCREAKNARQQEHSRAAI